MRDVNFHQIAFLHLMTVPMITLKEWVALTSFWLSNQLSLLECYYIPMCNSMFSTDSGAFPLWNYFLFSTFLHNFQLPQLHQTLVSVSELSQNNRLCLGSISLYSLWKVPLGKQPGQSQSSPHLFPFSKRSQLCPACYPVLPYVFYPVSWLVLFGGKVQY